MASQEPSAAESPFSSSLQSWETEPRGELTLCFGSSSSDAHHKMATSSSWQGSQLHCQVSCRRRRSLSSPILPTRLVSHGMTKGFLPHTTRLMEAAPWRLHTPTTTTGSSPTTSALRMDGSTLNVILLHCNTHLKVRDPTNEQQGYLYLPMSPQTAYLLPDCDLETLTRDEATKNTNTATNQHNKTSLDKQNKGSPLTTTETCRTTTTEPRMTHSLTAWRDLLCVTPAPPTNLKEAYQACQEGETEPVPFVTRHVASWFVSQPHEERRWNTLGHLFLPVDQVLLLPSPPNNNKEEETLSPTTTTPKEASVVNSPKARRLRTLQLQILLRLQCLAMDSENFVKWYAEAHGNDTSTTKKLKKKKKKTKLSPSDLLRNHVLQLLAAASLSLPPTQTTATFCHALIPEALYRSIPDLCDFLYDELEVTHPYRDDDDSPSESEEDGMRQPAPMAPTALLPAPPKQDTPPAVAAPPVNVKKNADDDEAGWRRQSLPLVVRPPSTNPLLSRTTYVASHYNGRLSNISNFLREVPSTRSLLNNNHNKARKKKKTTQVKRQAPSLDDDDDKPPRLAARVSSKMHPPPPKRAKKPASTGSSVISETPLKLKGPRRSYISETPLKPQQRVPTRPLPSPLATTPTPSAPRVAAQAALALRRKRS